MHIQLSVSIEQQQQQQNGQLRICCFGVNNIFEIVTKPNSITLVRNLPYITLYKNTTRSIECQQQQQQNG